MWNKADKNKKGFTLIELMAVVFILAIGLVGVSSLILQVFSFSRQAMAKLEASYLVQEGVEIARNIRDANWLKGINWDVGLASGDHEADFDDQALFSYQNRFLRIGNDFYNYDEGEQTKFKRKINIQKSDNQILVTVTISWTEGQRDYEVVAIESLYNWRQ